MYDNLTAFASKEYELSSNAIAIVYDILRHSFWNDFTDILTSRKQGIALV